MTTADAWSETPATALLVLSDGSVIEGQGLGATAPGLMHDAAAATAGNLGAGLSGYPWLAALAACMHAPARAQGLYDNTVDGTLDDWVPFEDVLAVQELGGPSEMGGGPVGLKALDLGRETPIFLSC